MVVGCGAAWASEMADALTHHTLVQYSGHITRPLARGAAAPHCRRRGNGRAAMRQAQHPPPPPRRCVRSPARAHAAAPAPRRAAALMRAPWPARAARASCRRSEFHRLLKRRRTQAPVSVTKTLQKPRRTPIYTASMRRTSWLEHRGSESGVDQRLRSRLGRQLAIAVACGRERRHGGVDEHHLASRDVASAARGRGRRKSSARRLRGPGQATRLRHSSFFCGACGGRVRLAIRAQLRRRGARVSASRRGRALHAARKGSQARAWLARSTNGSGGLPMLTTTASAPTSLSR